MRIKVKLCSKVFIFTIFTILALVVLSTALPSPSAAAVGIKVRPGLGGLYKVDQPLELAVTVENPGPAFDGTLLVRHDEERYGHRPDLARFVMNIKVPAGESKQFHMVIPGELARTQPLVELVSGGLVLAKSRVEGTAVSGGLVALALSEDITGGGSGLHTWLSGERGSQINLKCMSSGEIPANSLLLGVADVIMTGASGVSSLNEKQVRAIKEWVHLGGKLVLFAGAGAGKGGFFSDISPVHVTGKKTVAGKLGGLRSGGPLEVASGRLVAGREVVVEDGVPVVARRKLGRGQVLFCGIDPGDLGSEAGGIWSTLFDINQETGEDILRVKKLLAWGSNSLVYASSYLPQLAGPPVSLLAILWLIYVAAVGPVLYFILRRADRRDWAWFLVPAIALVAAGCFYLLAPVNRLQNYLFQTLATVEIFTPELAEVRAGTSIVFSRGGDLTVQTADNMYAVPVYQGGSPGSSNMSAIVHQEGEKTSIDFNDVEFGSLTKLYAYGLQRNFGCIEGGLHLKGNRVTGNLVNKTGLYLRDCRLLLLGGRVIKIGELPAGNTVHIEETLEKWRGFTNLEMLFTELGIKGNWPGEPFFRERQMLSELVQWETGYPYGIQFLGWHDGIPEIFENTGKPGQKEYGGMLLVKQRVDMDLVKGKFRLPAGFIAPRYVTREDGEILGSKGEFIIRGKTVKLVYDINDAEIGQDFVIDTIELQKVQGQFPYSAEIYNIQQDKWEPLPDEGRRIAGDDLARYVKDNKVTVRLTQKGDIYDLQQVWPGLAVEGVVSS